MPETNKAAGEQENEGMLSWISSKLNPFGPSTASADEDSHTSDTNSGKGTVSLKSDKNSTKHEVRKLDENTIQEFIPKEAMKAQTEEIKHQQQQEQFNSHTFKPDHLQKNNVYNRTDAKQAPRGTH